jgi:fumarate reductase subunit C
MVAGLALDEGIVAAKVVEGSFNRESFMDFLRNDVVSFLTLVVECVANHLLCTPASYHNAISWATKCVGHG